MSSGVSKRGTGEGKGKREVISRFQPRRTLSYVSGSKHITSIAFSLLSNK